MYWILHQDGVVQLDIKLTGILNTYALAPGESAAPWGTEVYPGVNAHNHQHMFCLRVDPNIDGQNNTIFQVDATQGDGEVGSEQNPYGNVSLFTQYLPPQGAAYLLLGTQAYVGCMLTLQ